MPLMFVGLSEPFREAVQGQFSEDESHNAVLVRCDGPTHWEQLADAITEPAIVAIAVLPDLVVEDYARALSLGAAGVVHIDTTSAIIADVVRAAIGGEVILPRQAAQALASLAQRTEPDTHLDHYERQLLASIADGHTIVDIAGEWHYSERTIRRHLQSIYLKLGVRNRTTAIAAAVRMGLADGSPTSSPTETQTNYDS